MIATESDSVYSAHHRRRWQCRHVFALHRLGQQGGGLFWATENLYCSLLVPFRRLPADRHQALLNHVLLILAVVLPISRHRGSVDDITAARDAAFLEQLHRYTIEQGLDTSFADAVLQSPSCVLRSATRRSARGSYDRAAGIPSARTTGCTAASSQNQNAHHRLGWLRWRPPPGADRLGLGAIALGHQCREVEARFAPGKRPLKKTIPLQW